MADAILLSAYLAALPIALFEGRAIIEIVVGTGEIFAGLLQIGIVGLPDIIELTVTFAEFILSQLFCFIKLSGNLPTCIFFYILDTIGQVLYLPVRLILWFMAFFIGVSLHPVEDKIWENIEAANCFVHSSLGFHLIHWPDNIIDNCYNCCRVKKEVLFNKAGKVGNDINDAWPLIGPGIQHLSDAAYHFTHPFD